MPICVAGMHRSGTSMLTRLLHLCGVYLGEPHEIPGPLPDNPEGHWENLLFTSLNERILAVFGGGWDLPPLLAQGWELSQALGTVYDEALSLIRRFNAHEPWGWKDPRNSLTLPFWQTLLPELKVVICLRDPLAVAESLRRRGSSSVAFGLQLWLIYYQQLLSVVRPRDRVVTHYDAYFLDPQAELARVLEFLALPVSVEVISQACATIQHSLRHDEVRPEALSSPLVSGAIRGLYAQLCEEAGPVCRAAVQARPVAERPVTGFPAAVETGAEALLAERQRAIESLSQQLTDKERIVERLSALVADQEQTIQALSAQLEGTERVIDSLRAQQGNLAAELQMIHGSRWWRLAGRYWAVTGRLRGKRRSDTRAAGVPASASGIGGADADPISALDPPASPGSGITTGNTSPQAGSAGARSPAGAAAARRIDHLRTFLTGLKFYLANHLVNRVPSFRLRHWYYRNILHYRVGRESAIHMGVFVTGDFVNIGDNVVINRNCYLDGRIGVEIRDNASISPAVWLISMEHDPDSPSFDTRGAPVIVEENVWIGARAIVTPGVTIARGAVIGAGAVVTRSIGPYRIAVGVPAREIRDRNRALDYRPYYFTWFDTDIRR